MVLAFSGLQMLSNTRSSSRGTLGISLPPTSAAAAASVSGSPNSDSSSSRSDASAWCTHASMSLHSTKLSGQACCCRPTDMCSSNVYKAVNQRKEAMVQPELAWEKCSAGCLKNSAITCPLGVGTAKHYES